MSNEPRPLDVANGRAPVISARGLTRSFDDQLAVDGVTFDVPAGSIVGLIGPSGCGKTTLVRLLTGIIRPTGGEVSVFGREPELLSAAERTRFGYMPQLPVLFPNLTLWSNLTFVASVYGSPLRGRRKRLMELLDLVDLAEHRHKQFVHTSGGMQRRLSLAATLVHDPELLFLDEPTAGVDPILRERFWSHFRELRDAGKTLVVSTQYVGEAVSCDHVAVMAGGRMIALETPEGLRRHAFGGGEPVSVPLGRGWLSGEEIGRIEDEPFVHSVRRTDDGLEVALGDIDRDVPLLARHLADAGITTGEIVPLDPSYDDIFVSIVTRHNATTGAAA